MQYLLDSRVFLWLDDREQVGGALHALLDDPEHELFLSAASVWEMTLKRAAGKLNFTGSFLTAVEAYNIAILPVLAEHMAEVEQLPRLHRDPFDHLLIAQARVEDLVLVTQKAAVARYPVATLRV